MSFAPWRSPDGQSGRYACCDVVNRGLAVWKGKVYLASVDGYLHAIDAKTGSRIWRVDTLPDRKVDTFKYFVTGAPAIAGDLVLAADNARFTVAYTAIGLAPDGSSTFTLPRLIGPKRAFELMCTNRPLSADEAKVLGLVNQVFPKAEFIQRAREFAADLARGPTAALGYAKRLVTLSAQSSLETQMEHERRAIAACGRTADFREGTEAFIAKRPPEFQGR